MEYENVTVTVRRTKKGLGHLESASLIRRAAAAALAEEGVDAVCHIDVTLTDGRTIHRLNRKYRGVDRATDVLSFPLNELAPGAFDRSVCEIDMDTGEALLGDIVISIPRCYAQGLEYGHGYRREISYLTVHSVLHLLGYDHVHSEEERKRMRSREDAVMARLNGGMESEI